MAQAEQAEPTRARAAPQRLQRSACSQESQPKPKTCRESDHADWLHAAKWGSVADAAVAAQRRGVAGAEDVLIFFHGLGLSHMELEQFGVDGAPNHDWQLEANMVVPLHILYPGDEHHRVWIEEVVRVTPDGGEPFFGWGLDPIITV